MSRMIPTSRKVRRAVVALACAAIGIVAGCPSDTTAPPPENTWDLGDVLWTQIGGEMPEYTLNVDSAFRESLLNAARPAPVAITGGDITDGTVAVADLDPAAVNNITNTVIQQINTVSGGGGAIDGAAIRAASLRASAFVAGLFSTLPVDQGGLPDGSIHGAKLIDGSLHGSKLINGTVTPEKLSFVVTSAGVLAAGAGLALSVDGNVSTVSIAVGGITSAMLANDAIDAIAVRVIAALGPGSIDGTTIEPGSLPAGTLTPNSVGSDQIGDGAVGTSELADGSVTAPKLAPTLFAEGSAVVQVQPGAIHGSKLATGTVHGDRLIGGTVASAQLNMADVVAALQASPLFGNLPAGSIPPGAISPGITGAQIADGTLTGADVQDGTLTGADVQDGSLSGADLAADTITAAQIAPNAVGASELADNSVDSAAIIDGQVLLADIADAAVGNAKLANGAVTTAKLADASVSTAKLADGAATTAKLGDGSVSSVKLTDGAVGTAKLADGAVTAAKLTDAAVTSAKILDGAIAEVDLSQAVLDRLLPSNPVFGDITAVRTGADSGLLGGVESGDADLRINPTLNLGLTPPAGASIALFNGATGGGGNIATASMHGSASVHPNHPECGSVILRNGAGQPSMWLGGDTSNGASEIFMYNGRTGDPLDDITVDIDAGNTTFGGFVQLFSGVPGNNQRMVVAGHSPATNCGRIAVNNGAGTTFVEILGDDPGVNGNDDALLRVCGAIRARTGNLTGGCDVAEIFEHTNSAEVQPGMVMVLDAENAGKLAVSAQAYDKRVAGIISGAGDLKPGVKLGQRADGSDDHPLALAGRVYCYVDATEHAVEVGDMLTTSDTPGHAMKAADPSRAFGCVLGKAMQPLAKGEKGLVLVLVSLQ